MFVSVSLGPVLANKLVSLLSRFRNCGWFRLAADSISFAKKNVFNFDLSLMKYEKNNKIVFLCNLKIEFGKLIIN